MNPFPALVCLLVSPANAAPFRVDLEEGRYLKVRAEAEIRLRQDPQDALAWAAQSQALSALQDFPGARAAAERALALRPDLADALLARGLARAGEAIRQRDLSALRGALGAMEDLRAATAADPTLATAWSSLGMAYELLPGILGGSTKKALQCAEALRRVAPAKGDLLQALILLEEGSWAQAEPWFQRALTKAPQDQDVVSQWLDALDSKPAKKALGEAGKNARLVAEAGRLLPGVRTRARALASVSDAYLHGGQPALAWQVLQASSGVDAPSLLRLQMGKVAAASGQHRAEALAALDQVLREPLEGGAAGLPGAWWRRGQILRDLGRVNEARQSAQAALRLDPKHRGARALLAQLP
jgi:tetratricopeptide (TPR) repeat protein